MVGEFFRTQYLTAKFSMLLVLPAFAWLDNREKNPSRGLEEA